MKSEAGRITLRQELPSHGTTENGDYLHFSIVPFRETGFGDYWYAKPPSSDDSESKTWRHWYFQHFDHEGLKPLGYQDTLHLPGPLQLMAEHFAREFDCDVHIKVQTEYTDIRRSDEVALWYQVSMHDIKPGIKDVQGFLRGLRNRIDRITLDYKEMIRNL